ncbi:MAG: hypothetical protein H0X03_00695 [Nitrosopumilus sp.]|nr:hypothetical protein [Nitrosopumilus sp.]
MSDEIIEELLRKFITTDDLFTMEWRILKYMCEMSGIYDTFPETLLFHRNDFKAFIDRKVRHEYSHDKIGRLYKLIMDKIMDCLKARDAVEIVSEYEYGDSKMILYGKKKELKDLCDEFKKYEDGDLALLDRLLPMGP